MNSILSPIIITAQFERNAYENEILNECILDWAYFFHDHNVDHKQFTEIVFKDMINKLIDILESYKITMHATNLN